MCGVDEKGEDVGVPGGAPEPGRSRTNDVRGSMGSFVDGFAPGFVGYVVSVGWVPPGVVGLELRVLRSNRDSKVWGGFDSTSGAEWRVVEGFRPLVDV